MGRKDSGHQRTPGTPNLLKKGKSPQPEDVEGGEVNDVVEIVTTTGDVDVVKEETHFKCTRSHRGDHGVQS
ncbi:hypothetical protein AB205_0141080 [Aquarana catesbeiana]|uniref:Uncharacterized protein n=1 Tax=Aquarana catesbeiana TaxID=8400 RepID=A0A2G9S111_AQUCT|nr:hypothetical protein AB205_0141080 [Aquarana catesbeiana]